MTPVWNEIEQTLLQIYSLPHNQIELRRRNTTPQAEAKKKLEQNRT